MNYFLITLAVEKMRSLISQLITMRTFSRTEGIHINMLCECTSICQYVDVDIICECVYLCV